MKHLAYNLIFGRDSRLSGAMAFGIVMLIALGCTCGKDFDLSNTGTQSNSSRTNTSGDSPFPSTSSDSDIPSKSELQTLLKTTAADFTQAIETEDFSEFYSNASSDFQSTFTEEQVKDGFKSYIDKKQAILPSLKKIQTTDAQFSPEPHIRTEKGLKILVLEGNFPTKPLNIKFDAEYVQRSGSWKLLVWKLVIG